jgi:acetyltransferase-like isoleucine patch superfamily enzyme
VGSSFSFRKYRSERPLGLIVGESASLYDVTTLHVGPAGQIQLGAFALIAGGALFCESNIQIGSYALIAWNVVIMDSLILSRDRTTRRRQLEAAAFRSSRWLGPGSGVEPVRIGKNVWISFGACIYPGVTIGDHAIVGAQAVVCENVPSRAVVAGNPARVVRMVEDED